jgi:hypothetical protein
MYFLFRMVGKGDDLSPLLVNFPSECTIKKAKEKRERL